MSDKYILDADGKPVVCNDLLTWAKWFESADRQVAKTRLGVDVTVSTVFLGLDHSFGRDQHLPQLYETMIFGGPHDGYQERYMSKDEALAGHEAALKVAKGEGS